MKDLQLHSGVTDNWKNKAIRFKRGEHGDQKYFSYARGKSKNEAIAEANAYAEEYTKRYGPPRPVSYKGIFTVKNRSGKPGVHFCKKSHSRRPNHIYWYWGAEWPRSPYTKCFSVLKHGDEKAFVLACIACELETMDSDFVLAEYSQFVEDGRAGEFLKQKKQSLPLDE